MRLAGFGSFPQRAPVRNIHDGFPGTTWWGAYVGGVRGQNSGVLGVSPAVMPGFPRGKHPGRYSATKRSSPRRGTRREGLGILGDFIVFPRFVPAVNTRGSRGPAVRRRGERGYRVFAVQVRRRSHVRRVPGVPGTFDRPVRGWPRHTRSVIEQFRQLGHYPQTHKSDRLSTRHTETGKRRRSVRPAGKTKAGRSRLGIAARGITSPALREGVVSGGMRLLGLPGPTRRVSPDSRRLCFGLPLIGHGWKGGPRLWGTGAPLASWGPIAVHAPHTTLQTGLAAARLWRSNGIQWLRLRVAVTHLVTAVGRW